MSDKCGNCDCADRSQCVKKGSSYAADIVETENTFVETFVMMEGGAQNGKCKCGPSCACVNCTCDN
uniref:Metallothionein type 3 n=1 Tax=Coffea arabica TaxID=13443 RepID=R4MUV4_COFAR|nr:metallothionein type 3 [Coffea arabica]